MKVLLAAYACIPNRGREEGFGWNSALQIAKLGHEVWVITIPNSATECEENLEAKKNPNLHFVSVEYPWLKNLPYGRYKYFHKLRYLAWKNKAEKIAKQLNQEHKFDLFHHITVASLQAGPLFSSLKKPLIFGPVGGGQTAPINFKEYFFDRWSDEAIRSLIGCKLIFFNPFLRRALRKSNLVLATNQDTVELAKKLGAPHVELFLDSGLPAEYFPNQLPKRSYSQELRLLWLSKIEPRKGLFLALEALSFVNSTIPFKLNIIGDGPLASHVNEWIEHFDLVSKVEYHGALPWTEVKNSYLNSDAFLFTSLRDSYGSVLLEAMSQALPIITLNHHGAKDFVPECAGVKVPVTTPQETISALTQAIEYMYKYPEKRLEMGRVSYEFAKQQSWNYRAERICRYYESILLEEGS